MNDEIRKAFATVTRYQNATKVIQYFHVGAGPYALLAVFADGRRLVKAVGFESIGDAEVFAAYADHAAPAQRDRIIENMRAQGMEIDPAPWDHFEIVRLEPAIGSGMLEQLTRALKDPSDGR